jgi:CheY-specific phosphatase CheX
MQDTSSNRTGYVLVALLGGIGGGLVVAFATRAIPKMMSQIMSGMMQSMMAQMREGGCDPQEM